MGAAIGFFGGVLGAIGQAKQAKQAKKAEAARQAQMNLEATRKQRDIIREAQQARATAISGASAQGASEGTALAGGISQITTQGNRNTQASLQDQEIGNKVFMANKKYASAGSLIAFGGGLQSLGNAIGSYK